MTRVNVSCPHRPPCPGCPRFGEAGIAPAALAALDTLAGTHGLPAVPVVSGAAAGFRLRARLAIRGRLGAPKIGMFQLGTHRLAHIPNCVIHHPLVNRVADVVRRSLVDAGVSIYSEATHAGLARYLQVVVERGSQTAQVVLVGNCATPEPLASCLDLIRDRLGPELHSLWFNANGARTNTILGPEFHRWCGPESVTERFGGAAVHYPPGAFGQNNLEVAERIVEHVRGLVPQGACVAEFYAGVGATIGLSLLPKVATLRMNEVSPPSLRGLELGLAGLDPADRAKVEVIPGSAGDACAAAAEADVVIADPPRKGLDPPLREQIAVQPPGRLIYVSCGLGLPYTEHVETVGVFEHA